MSLVNWLADGFRKSVLHGLNYQGYAKPIGVDDDGAATVITDIHHHTHEGEVFVAGHIFAGVLTTASVDMVLVASSTLQTHFGFNGQSSGGGRVMLYKAPTYTPGAGTAITPFNMNDRLKVAGVVDPTDVTVEYYTTPLATPGTEIPVGNVVPGGSGGNAVGGQATSLARGVEIVADPGEVYVLRFTNDSATSENVSLQFGFYHKALNG